MTPNKLPQQDIALRRWLASVGLQHYAESLEQHDVRLDVIAELSDGDLKEMGVTLGDRRRLLKAIAEFQQSSQQPSSTDTATVKATGREAERRQLTVLFCDLVDSTKLTQQLDPEDLRSLMQAYQGACRDIITRYDGHVAQYLGDGLMVYFGWPMAHEDDASRAIHAALDIVEVVSKLTSFVPIRARLGIHTGLVVVGDTGAGDASVPKAAVGETPNIAARLQALAEPDCVVLSERTRSLAKGLFEYVDLGSQILKGITEPVRLYGVLRATSVESRFEASHRDAGVLRFVGREEEIALLIRRFQEAKDGEGQVILIVGEAGIGKSRLTRALEERLLGESHGVLRYQCSPLHSSSALYPIIRQLQQSLGFEREDTNERKLEKLRKFLQNNSADVEKAAYLLAATLSLSADHATALTFSPEQQKDETLEVLVDQVECIARRQPTIVIYEDVHWIEEHADVREIWHHLRQELESFGVSFPGYR